VSIIGLDMGGTKCAAVLATDDGEILSSRRFPTRDVEGTLAGLEKAVEELKPVGRLLFGVSCGGPLDSPRGMILSPPNLPGWDRIHITQRLVERFGGEAHLMNDANAGALAEWRWGAARGCRNVVFCTHGTGFGAGVILDGRLYEGTSDAAGEVGHVRLTEDGPVGFGKAGSVEGWCSGGGVARLARSTAEARGLSRAFGRDSLAEVTARDVFDAARRGEELALEVVGISARKVGAALAVIVDLLNPEVIVLGSIFARCRDLIEPPMWEVLASEALPASLAACRVVPSELGERIGDCATVAVALYRTGRLGP